MGVLLYFVMYLRGKNWPKRKEKGVTKYKQIDGKSLKGYRAKREGRKKKIKNKKVRTKKKKYIRWVPYILTLCEMLLIHKLQMLAFLYG